MAKSGDVTSLRLPFALFHVDKAESETPMVAEFERETVRERVRAGLANARQNGKRLGRPQKAALQSGPVRKLCRAGVSKAEIVRRLNIGRASVRRILQERV